MIDPVAILGAGMMGAAIAASHLRCGVPIVLYDNVAATLESAPRRIAEELRLQNCPFDRSLLSCTEKLDDVCRRPVLIETITEKLRAKQKLYRAIGALSGSPPGFLFTNTSTISISSLAVELAPPLTGRFCGFHFFHPVRSNSLIEIIPGAATAPETVEAARRHALRIDKQPIVVKDGPGFLVNRILNPYLTTALTLLGEGVDMQRIERLAVEFGMRMGPFRIMDEIGLDVVLHAGWVLFKAFPDRVSQSPLLVTLVELRRLGRKTGRGFMLYPNSTSWDGDGMPDPELPLQSTGDSRMSDDEIVRRLFVSMKEEALRCLEDGVISDPQDANRASILALGYPAEKGGVLHA